MKEGIKNYWAYFLSGMMVINAHFYGNRRLSFPTHKLHHRDRNIPFSVLGAEENSLIRKRKQLNEMSTQK